MTAIVNTRQREIVEVLIRYGWDYMRQLLTLGQGDEPEVPAPEILCMILTDLEPVFVKLGQLMSTRPDLLPPAYIEALSELQSNVPPVSWEEIEAVLQKQLPQPLEQVFERIEQVPVAAGSIAQTHRAVLKTGEQVAIKVQRPTVEDIVRRDIGIFKQIAGLLSGTDFGKRYSVVALADEFGRSLQHELDFTQEASYTDQLRKNLSESSWFDADRIIVPKVYHQFSSKKMLVLEWLDGVPILRAQLKGIGFEGDIEAERKAISTLCFRAFFQQYLVDGFFHADPHPGNLFYLRDGRVGLLDCGMMGVLNPRMQSIIVELVLAIIDLDADRCTQLTLQLADPMDINQPPNLAQMKSDYEKLLRRYYNLSLSNVNLGEVFSQILNAARQNNLRVPSNVGLLTKSIANLEGAGREFNPDVNALDEIKPLMRDLFRLQIAGEDPIRSLLRVALEFKQLSLASPRQFGFLLNRLSSETLRWNVAIEDLNTVRRTIDNAENRRSVSTVVAALIIGAAIVSTAQVTPQSQLIANILFGAASFLGLWLIYRILRSR
ncbi:ABC1 kinase family protein [Egbenema bharatensis]|uniref:ABC1 kinase family protein n=1 Tax=Egbenema bharatensis TaxID=3463334 RepID=UPI003A8AEE70